MARARLVAPRQFQMNDYRVNLDIYNGPLDLLLYLIQRDELDIYDIPISRITEQYLQYVGMLQQLDPNLAGEFLVLAATLMEIKTRMLLPSPPPQEAAAATVELDPRAELIRQLLQYKAFKDAAADLAQAAARQSRRFARGPGDLPRHDPSERDLEDVQLWDLLDAFGRIMEAIGQRPTHQEVIYDDTPVELHAADILDRLDREGPLTFDRVFEGRTGRSELVGLFLALLELIRQRRVRARQEANFGRIYVELSLAPPEKPDAKPGREPAAPGSQQAAGIAADESLGPDMKDEPISRPADGSSVAAPPASPEQKGAVEGRYVGREDRPEWQDDDDDTGTEAAGTGH